MSKSDPAERAGPCLGATYSERLSSRRACRGHGRGVRRLTEASSATCSVRQLFAFTGPRRRRKLTSDRVGQWVLRLFAYLGHPLDAPQRSEERDHDGRQPRHQRTGIEGEATRS